MLFEIVPAPNMQLSTAPSNQGLQMDRPLIGGGKEGSGDC